jgi:uncharacterized protein YfaP (DUF2135 family)
LECIEVWEDDEHWVLPADEALRMAQDRYEAPYIPPPSVSATVSVQAPNGKWAEEQFYDMQEAEEFAARLRSVIGPERVTLRAL